MDDRRDALSSEIESARTRSVTLDDDPELQQLELSELLNRVLDRGAVIAGTVTLSVANIDLVQLDLRLVLSAVETAVRGRKGPPLLNAHPGLRRPPGS